MTKTDWLHQHKQEIIEQYTSGVDTVELGRRYGCSNALVWLTLKKWGINPRSPRLTEETKQRILSAHTEGKSGHRISKELGISKSAVTKVLNENGIDISHRWRGGEHGVSKWDVHEEEIVRLHNQGWTGHRIAKEIGLTKSTVTKALKKNGIDISHKRRRRADPFVNHKSEIVSRFRDGEELSSIAKSFDCGASIIARHLRLWGEKVPL